MYAYGCICQISNHIANEKSIGLYGDPILIDFFFIMKCLLSPPADLYVRNMFAAGSHSRWFPINARLQSYTVLLDASLFRSNNR